MVNSKLRNQINASLVIQNLNFHFLRHQPIQSTLIVIALTNDKFPYSQYHCRTGAHRAWRLSRYQYGAINSSTSNIYVFLQTLHFSMRKIISILQLSIMRPRNHGSIQEQNRPKRHSTFIDTSPSLSQSHIHQINA